jgi:hypothetical protein
LVVKVLLPMSVHLSRVLWLAPPPSDVAAFPRSRQSFNTLSTAPPPLGAPPKKPKALLVITMQFSSVLEAAPPPYVAELPKTVQLLNTA